MIRTHSQIAKHDKYRNSRAFIANKYSNGYEDTICASMCADSLSPCPWDSIISASPLARNALCSEPIGTKKVGLRRIKNPPIGTKKVGLLGFNEARRKERSFGKVYYTATSEEETYFGITKSWESWKNYSYHVTENWNEEEHVLWTVAKAWTRDMLNYNYFRGYYILDIFCESIWRLKVFIRFVNYNIHWTTPEYFNAKHDKFHASMLAFCREIDLNKDSLIGYAMTEDNARSARSFFKNLKIVLDQVSLFRKKYAEYSALRTLALGHLLKVDENVSSTILTYLY